jgi:hypothetical protein
MDAVHIFILAAQAVLSSLLWWSSFCRLTHTDRETIREIRAAVWFQGAVATTMTIAPYLPLIDKDFTWPVYTTPVWVWLCLLASQVCIQIATSRHWYSGVPRSYIKPEYRPMRRSIDSPSFEETTTC